MNIVILAGGGGTRLWPISRTKRPKQFSSIISDLTMIEETFNRFKKDYPIDNIFICTTPILEGLARKTLPQIRKDHYIIDPEKRDTGPAMAYAAAYLSVKKNPDEPMAFIASDHYIKKPKLLVKCLKQAEKMIKKTGKMVDIAITTTFPSVNLGYTKIGKLYKNANGIKFYEFKGQTEKPDLARAKKFHRLKNYLWHANFFMWTPSLLLEAYKKYAPGIYNPIKKVIQGLKENNKSKVKKAFSKTEKISIDYAVAEKMDPKDVLIIQGEFGWSDIGDWKMLYNQLQNTTDKNRNLIKGNIISIDSKNNVIYGSKRKLISIIGLENSVVVNTDDALLVCNKEKTHLVKQLVEQLKSDKKLKKYI